MAAGTVKPPPADLRRPRGREALPAHPPAPVDDTTSGRLERRAESTSAPATRVLPETRRPRQDRGLGLEQGRDRAPAPRCRHTAHPRPDRRIPRRVRHGRLPRGRWSRRRPRRHRAALPDHPRTARRRLRRLARPPDQRRALPRPARRQPHPTPTVHDHRAHQRGLLRGARQRPHGRRLHLARIIQEGSDFGREARASVC